MIVICSCSLDTTRSEYSTMHCKNSVVGNVSHMVFIFSFFCIEWQWCYFHFTVCDMWQYFVFKYICAVTVFWFLPFLIDITPCNILSARLKLAWTLKMFLLFLMFQATGNSLIYSAVMDHVFFIVVSLYFAWTLIKAHWWKPIMNLEEVRNILLSTSVFRLFFIF